MPSHASDALCRGCGTCDKECPVIAIAMEDRKPVVRDYLCTECGICTRECPIQVRRIAEAQHS